MWKQMMTGLFQFVLTIVVIVGVVWWMFFDDSDMSAVEGGPHGAGKVASQSAGFSEPRYQAPALPSADAGPGPRTAALPSGHLSTVQAELKVLQTDAATPGWLTSTWDTGHATDVARAEPKPTSMVSEASQAVPEPMPPASLPAQAAPEPQLTPAAPVPTQAAPQPSPALPLPDQATPEPAVEPVATPEPKPAPAASARTKADTEPAPQYCERPQRGDPQAWDTYRRCWLQQRAARQCARRQAGMLARLTTEMNRCRMMGPRAASCQAHYQVLRRQMTASCQGVPGN